MRFRFSRTWLVLALSVLSSASGQRFSQPSSVNNDSNSSKNTLPLAEVPTGVILVKGAWSTASDSVTSVPEEATVTNGVFNDPYFGITYSVPKNWTEKFKGPPPSASGRYVLAEIGLSEPLKGLARGSILIIAQDLFFTPLPAANATELIHYMKDNLQADYEVDTPPREIQIAERSFAFFSYWSPVAQLHWYILATQIRCHAVEIVMSSRDIRLLQDLLRDMNGMELPEEASPAGGLGGGTAPACIKDYARAENMITRVDPVLTGHKFNPVPVRIIIDKQGNIKHIHFLNAFSDQVQPITDALSKWKFKRYQRNGQPVEVETGIWFGNRPAYR